MNENGSFDAGEQGIGGVVVNLLRSGIHVSSQTTDSSGHYEFTDLRAANYDVVVDNSSLPSERVINDDSIAVTIADGEQNDSVDFSAIEYVNPVDLALLIPLFGAGLTDSISSVVFNGFVDDATNVTTIGDLTFIDTNNNRIVFKTETFGQVNLGQVRMVGTLPTGLPDNISIQLANLSRAGETLHIGGVLGGQTPVISLNGQGSGTTVGRLISGNISTFGRLAPDPVAASTDSIILSISTDSRVLIQDLQNAGQLPTVSLAGVNEWNDTIILGDGRQLNIRVNTDVTFLSTNGAGQQVADTGNIEFELTALNGRDISDVRIVQFYAYEDYNADGTVRLRELAELEHSPAGRPQLYISSQRLLLDSLDGNIYADQHFNSTREGSTLKFWDNPEGSQEFDNTTKFITYITVGNQVAYEIGWDDVVTISNFAGMTTPQASYENINGRVADRFVSPLLNPTLTYGYHWFDTGDGIPQEFELTKQTTPNLFQFSPGSTIVDPGDYFDGYYDFNGYPDGSNQ